MEQQLKSEMKSLSKALKALTDQVTGEIQFRHEADARQNTNIGHLEDSIMTVSEKVSKMSESVVVLVSQKKDRDDLLKELRRDIKDHLDKADRVHDKMEKTAKDYTDSKTKGLRKAIDFRTKIIGTALALMVSAAGVVGHYIIDEFKEEIALMRVDVKENEYAISNQEK